MAPKARGKAAKVAERTAAKQAQYAKLLEEIREAEADARRLERQTNLARREVERLKGEVRKLMLTD